MLTVSSFKSFKLHNHDIGSGKILVIKFPGALLGLHNFMKASQKINVIFSATNMDKQIITSNLLTNKIKILSIEPDVSSNKVGIIISQIATLL